MSDILDANISRRSAVRLFALGAGIVAAGLFLPEREGLADGTGSGSISAPGTGPGGSGSDDFPNGYLTRWCDEGGFHSTEGGVGNGLAAVQGWNKPSSDWFWENQVMASMRAISGNASIAYGESKAQTWDVCAAAALAGARTRATKNQGHTVSDARIIGMGMFWCCDKLNNPPEFYLQGHRYSSFFNQLVRKVDHVDPWELRPNGAIRLYYSNAIATDELKTLALPGGHPALPKGGLATYQRDANGRRVKTGWADKIEATAVAELQSRGGIASTSTGWRDYIYESALMDNQGDTSQYDADHRSGNGLAMVVIAVADGEPGIPTGHLQLRKTLDI